jgi:uncharacterized membrane protein
MIRIDEIHAGAGYRLILTPNCSMSWRQLLAFYLLTCALAIVIGLLFTLQGQWLILPFSGLEMLVLGSALLITSRKVSRREIITVNKDRVRIEKGRHKAEQQWDFKRCWIKLVDEFGGENRPQRKLTLGSHGRYVEVGDFLSNIEKDELAFRLKDCIISR